MGSRLRSWQRERRSDSGTRGESISSSVEMVLDQWDRLAKGQRGRKRRSSADICRALELEAKGKPSVEVRQASGFIQANEQVRMEGTGIMLTMKQVNGYRAGGPHYQDTERPCIST